MEVKRDFSPTGDCGTDADLIVVTARTRSARFQPPPLEVSEKKKKVTPGAGRRGRPRQAGAEAERSGSHPSRFQFGK